MINIIDATLISFSNILKWNTMKHAIIVALVAFGIWGGLGYLFWDSLMAISSNILELLPFSMLRSNGAWMLSAFLWFQVVLVTYAIIYALFGNLILQKVAKDKFPFISMLIIILSAIFWGIIWYIEHTYIYQELLKVLTWLPFETLEGFMAFLVIFYILYNGIIVTILFLTSIFSYPLIKSIDSSANKKHIFQSLKYTFKDTIIFTILSVILFILLFIPIINIFVQIILWTWLTKDTISHDALYLADKAESKNFLKEHKVAIYTISIISVLFNFIPFINIFGPFFGEIAMYNYFKRVDS